MAHGVKLPWSRKDIENIAGLFDRTITAVMSLPSQGSHSRPDLQSEQSGLASQGLQDDFDSNSVSVDQAFHGTSLEHVERDVTLNHFKTQNLRGCGFSTQESLGCESFMIF